jgi:hypothetical protein
MHPNGPRALESGVSPVPPLEMRDGDIKQHEKEHDNSRRKNEQEEKVEEENDNNKKENEQGW